MTEPQDFKDIKGSLFRVPLSFRGWPKWLVWLLSAVGVLYILNPTAGILEFLPDNLPILGNLDEGLAYLLVYYGIMEFIAPYLNFDGQKHSVDDDDVVNAEWEEEKPQ
ncbi:MAG: DUF1232 domain-containing protein [Anaerolineae bacterium]|nr:DUF1232 domain-containing protein [Anaerolineae bacterium]